MVIFSFSAIGGILIPVRDADIRTTMGADLYVGGHQSVAAIALDKCNLTGLAELRAALRLIIAVGADALGLFTV
jgi:hypothetical protein